jgi:hypothetical protein
MQKNMYACMCLMHLYVIIFIHMLKRLLLDVYIRTCSHIHTHVHTHRYMVYGKGNTFNVERLLELFQAFETFVDVRDSEPIGQAAPVTEGVFEKMGEISVDL